MKQPNATPARTGKTAKHAAHAAVLPAFVATLLASAEDEEKLIDELCAAVLCGDVDAAKKTAVALTGRRGQHVSAKPHSAETCSE